MTFANGSGDAPNAQVENSTKALGSAKLTRPEVQLPTSHRGDMLYFFQKFVAVKQRCFGSAALRYFLLNSNKVGDRAAGVANRRNRHSPRYREYPSLRWLMSSPRQTSPERIVCQRSW